MHEDCWGKHALPRRQVLQGGLAAAAVGGVGAAGTAAVAPRVAMAAPAGGARAIDIHAHYYPQAYLDVLGEQGKQYNFDYPAAPDGFFIGPQHYETKFTHLTLPLADTDAPALPMPALPLPPPIPHF